MSKLPSLLCVVGARPNFMKIAPIFSQLSLHAETMSSVLVHTGQHYDAAMKDAFFEQLGIPEPDIDLGVGSGTHAVQTAQTMLKFEPVLDRVDPRAVLVVGDVNSTIACGLVAVKKKIPLIHVEAGLRSYDREMPEEINRVLTDQISDLLFTTERSARDNLLREGIADDRIHFVGNVMIDTLRNHLPKAVPVGETIAHYLPERSRSFDERAFALLTLHRPSNVDNPEILRKLLDAVAKISEKLPVVFPIHPRTRKMVEQAGLEGYLDNPAILPIPPVGYLEMLGLMKSAKLVMTDSGGVQEETTALGIPCITLRENTERPITVEQGTNTVVGSDPVLILSCVDDILLTGGKAGKIPELWDGKTSERIVDRLREKYFSH
ncbi:MAG: UDP-N-acetylglucosamine 2-epimerase (non-hydrolyzing) [Methylococcaceae bacterium]|nr:UDP-N-acetylglucosamine 2-epimerase (non-hydrolyzing) [Methylococcaceae bacterium]